MLFSMIVSTHFTNLFNFPLERRHISNISWFTLINAEIPLVITGVASEWNAIKKWNIQNLETVFEAIPFHLHDTYNKSVTQLLNTRAYVMGHVLPSGHCYDDPWRPFSPIFESKNFWKDIHIPELLSQMTTFQVGVGNRIGGGVPPENHPQSWFAVVFGRKRWIIHPPDITQPPSFLKRDTCNVKFPLPTKSIHYLQSAGEILWLPNMWWHETCGIDHASLGIGGLISETVPLSETKCTMMDYDDNPRHHFYGTDDIPYCQTNTCQSLDNILNRFRSPFTQRD